MTPRARRTVVLLAALACFWVLLSGHFEPQLLALGAASCVFVAWLALRKSLIEEESVLTQVYWGRWLRYTVWLAAQIIKSAIDVAGRIIDPRLPISPVVDQVPADLPDLGKVIYANSITLTPGTVSINLTEDAIVVHSLSQEGMDELKGGEMYRRVKQLVKPPPC